MFTAVLKGMVGQLQKDLRETDDKNDARLHNAVADPIKNRPQDCRLQYLLLPGRHCGLHLHALLCSSTPHEGASASGPTFVLAQHSVSTAVAGAPQGLLTEAYRTSGLLSSIASFGYFNVGWCRR